MRITRISIPQPMELLGIYITGISVPEEMEFKGLIVAGDSYLIIRAIPF